MPLQNNDFLTAIFSENSEKLAFIFLPDRSIFRIICLKEI